jgi:hypothetical protein
MMKARPLLRRLPAMGFILAMAGFLLAPATPAGAQPVDLCGGEEIGENPFVGLDVLCEVLQPVFLSVAKAGIGTGTVATTDGAINCLAASTGCETKEYPRGTSVGLTALASPGSSFAGWLVGGGAADLSPPECSGLGPCTFRLDGDTGVIATFNAIFTVAAASACHLHQHGGIVTGPFHHGLSHLKKHTHTHCHAYAAL